MVLDKRVCQHLVHRPDLASCLLSNSRLNFSLRPIIELACILAAVQTASWPFHDTATAMPTSNTATVFLLFGITWCLVTRWLGSRDASTRNQRLRALQHTTRMWGLTWACAGLLAVATLNLPVLRMCLTLLYGWTLLALLTLLRTSYAAHRESLAVFQEEAVVRRELARIALAHGVSPPAPHQVRRARVPDGGADHRGPDGVPDGGADHQGPAQVPDEGAGHQAEGAATEGSSSRDRGGQPRRVLLRV